MKKGIILGLISLIMLSIGSNVKAGATDWGTDTAFANITINKSFKGRPLNAGVPVGYIEIATENGTYYIAVYK